MNEEYRSAIAALKSGSAPERVEHNVIGAFRRQKRSRVARRWGVGAVAAGVLVAVGAIRLERLQQPNIIAPPAPLTAHIAAPALVAVTPLVETARAPRVQPRRIKRREEIVTPYYPLPSADSLPAPDAEAVVRMMVPGSTLQLVGFPANEVLRPEFVRADVVVGQDGMARAIRFVQ